MPATRQNYDLAADPYVAARRSPEVEAHAMNDAIDEFRKWDTTREKGELLKMWATQIREGN
jgi:hypothetical protein